MSDTALKKMVEMARRPGSVEDTVRYLSDKMGFLRENERVLICFPNRGEGSIGAMLEQAVLQCDAIPVMWGDDLRWKTLLRLAFSCRAGTVIGPPLVILGLWKLAKANGTPLYIRNAMTAGYPCLDWMIDGIIRGLDCRTWGCFDPGDGTIVAGFSCAKSRGVHIRESEYAVEILDGDGRPAPSGSVGDIVLSSRACPDVRWQNGQQGRLDTTPCACGCSDVRLMDIAPGRDTDPVLTALGCELHSWTSILDCRIERGEYGLELEVITFPGYQLPKLPSCAKLIIRPWEPERDIPFGLVPDWEIPSYCAENH
jgi:phenylacetate-coenzyme A ligase PaaK-like adenylate-forming protein